MTSNELNEGFLQVENPIWSLGILMELLKEVANTRVDTIGLSNRDAS